MCAFQKCKAVLKKWQKNITSKHTWVVTLTKRLRKLCQKQHSVEGKQETLQLKHREGADSAVYTHVFTFIKLDSNDLCTFQYVLLHACQPHACCQSIRKGNSRRCSFLTLWILQVKSWSSFWFISYYEISAACIH